MKISVIIPMYNEEKIIADTAREVAKYMSENFPEGEFEVLFSNDGSLDNSAEAVTSLDLRGVRVVGYEKNRGKGCAVRTAMLEASGDLVVFTDADLAYGTEVIGKLYESYKENSDAKVFIGSRNKSADGYSEYTLIRKIMSKTYIKVVSLFGGFKSLSDFQCGCKAFTGEATKKIFSNCTVDGFAFDLEALMIATKLKYKIVEIPVKIINHRESKVNIVKDTLKMLSDLRKIKKRVKKLDLN
ncbi:MAG: glycosyltransferase [Clostridia bacterium]|nr:glycosyltransferase [Clostridia bacterium]